MEPRVHKRTCDTVITDDDAMMDISNVAQSDHPMPSSERLMYGEMHQGRARIECCWFEPRPPSHPISHPSHQAHGLPFPSFHPISHPRSFPTSCRSSTWNPNGMEVQRVSGQAWPSQDEHINSDMSKLISSQFPKYYNRSWQNLWLQTESITKISEMDPRDPDPMTWSYGTSMWEKQLEHTRIQGYASNPLLFYRKINIEQMRRIELLVAVFDAKCRQNYLSTIRIGSVLENYVQKLL